MLHPFSARAAAGQAHLRILATTDLHCHVQPYDYYADKPSDTLGLARTASIIEEIRAEATNTMLVDNGDYLQGNPMGDYLAYERGMKPGDIHPVMAGMNTLAFDAGTLGNHEFNYGVGFLDLVNAGANFPIVCANFGTALGAGPREDKLHLKPYVILDRTISDGAGVPSTVRVGLIGFVPPQIMMWDRGHLEGGFAVRDILEAARAWVPEMREAGADIVVALSHSGLAAGPDAPMLENAAFQLAGIEGIDAIVTGHQHLVWPGEDFSGDGFDATTGACAASRW
jgi:2',3'-cyclic-nucleotide 2'-phosphodiesterase/3'-nucleotidase